MRRTACLLASLFIAACTEPAGPLVSCDVAGPGVACDGIDVSIAPYVTNGGPFGGFQAVAGTSYQADITITFSKPVQSVTVTALDPDFTGNVMIAYNGNSERARVSFEGDNLPGVLTISTKTVRGSNITRVVLRPDPLDYLAYTSLSIEY